MWYEEYFDELRKEGNKEQASKMSAYMQDQFPFLGIPSPALKQLQKPIMKEAKRHDFDWQFVLNCWQKDYREYQYLGITYLTMFSKKLDAKDLDNIYFLITNKSWWETVDSLDSIVGEIVLRDSSLKDLMRTWSKDDNFWVRRVAIDFQQRYKEETDAELLAEIIVNNLGSKEFFINKAIGWALREHSKVNPRWVADFLEEHEDKLAKLSIKEASKYL